MLRTAEALGDHSDGDVMWTLADSEMICQLILRVQLTQKVRRMSLT